MKPYGNAKFYGSMAGKYLKAPIVGIVATADGRGYWLVAKDGGVFSFGDATFEGSLGDKTLPLPVVGMASSDGGTAATRGAQGLKGPVGAKGAVGPRGATGPAGARGAVGTAGPAGALGATGAAGARGAIGPAGARGPTGAIGPAGARGPTGAIGPAGARGPTGAIGPAGARGPSGAAGPNGATGATGAVGATGATGTSGTADIAEFYALMPPDNAAPVAPGTAVEFPNNGPAEGSGSIVRTGSSSFMLSNIGTYNVSFVVSVTEAGQLGLAVNGLQLAYTVVGRATGTSEIVGESLVTTTSVNALLTVVNPVGESTALSITPLAGGVNPVSATLEIQQLG